MKYLQYFESFNIDIYEHGRCEIFALALHKELNYDVFFLLDDEAYFDDFDEEKDRTVLIHAYTKDEKGNMFDAKGLISEEDLEDHADFVNSPRTIKVSEKEFNEFIKSKFIARYSPKELLECQIHIRNNVNKYKI